MWDQLLGQSGTEDRVGRILELIERLQKIQSAANTIRYDEQLSMEIPDVLKTLGDAKDEVIAKLKLV
jgi:hypothetical protein